ncbi:MAG: ATP-binding protein [Lachnospiraceae bacterium]
MPKLLGYALKELLAPIITIVISCIAITILSKSIVQPIIEINEATKEIAQGNFDIHLDHEYLEDEFEQLTKNFNIMAKELKSNEYLRKNFISNVSHEFKTPVAIISGYVKLIDQPDTTQKERAEYCSIIENECEKCKLSANILSLSRLDNQSIPDSKDTFCLDEQIRQSIIYLEPKWGKKNIDFSIDTDEINYTGSEALMSHVWTNLIDNAIKFSNNNGIITVTLHETDTYIIATVEDRGIGMDEYTRNHIFDRFFQGDTSHKSDGNGLGLSLAKNCRLSGGKISGKYARKGSTFKVYLYKPAEEKVEAEVTEASRFSRLKSNK